MYVDSHREVKYNGSFDDAKGGVVEKKVVVGGGRLLTKTMLLSLTN